MFVEYLSLTDFRTYPQLDLALRPGVTVFVGANGIGKTNIVEAIGYLASLSSHRVSSDAPLVRFGAERALVRAKVARGSQSTSLELELNPGRANRVRINRANPVRARDSLGILRTVLFAPEDLALVKGDPGNRRRFLDELLSSLVPHHAATRSDFERVLKQRNALLKSARASGRFTAAHESTLEVWDQHMAQAGAALLRGRLDVVRLLRPQLEAAYASLTDGSKAARAVYRSTIDTQLSDDGEIENDGGVSPEVLENLSVPELAQKYLEAFKRQRKKEVERGVSLVGPHRDELELLLGPAPAKGYASHGETWSMALSLRLASYYVFCEDDHAPGATPVLILDDVFAELDTSRRERLAEVVAGAEQVIVTAAVAEDIPAALQGAQLVVVPGGVTAGAN
ncbi:recombination protein F [Arthrobacter crystallopoietes BAB-32]|uniref:DNA replication and repair protein RecF n=1 Tax=Arthrobacter crystallopoietes BAB-32 TaxID=1246476 RepID=N1V4M1_9MICC|nr:DNA replication/repair protein RecF [Arthrobacter crystallopoietes]EMY34964.1 recombination protein F [Arthrobacter crystallopoietes BAB-32]